MEPSHSTAAVDATRTRRRPLARALDTVGWIAAAGMLVLVATTACDTTEFVASTITGEIKAGSEQQSDSDPNELELVYEGATEEAALDAAFTSPHLVGDVWNAELRVEGSDALSTVTLEKSVCFTVVEDFDVGTFLSMTFQFEKSCVPGATGTLDAEIDWRISKNGTELTDEGYHWVVAGSCANVPFTTTGLPNVQTNIPNFRLFAHLNRLENDDVTGDVGDEFRIDATTTLSLALEPGSDGSRLEMTANYRHDVNGAVEVHPCDQECTTDAGCPGELCENGICDAFTFDGKVIDVTVVTTPELDVTVQFADGVPRVERLAVEVPADAVNYTPVTTPNQGVGIVTLGPIQELLLATANPNVLYVDLDNDAALDPMSDPTFTIVEDVDAFALTGELGAAGLPARTLPGGTMEIRLFSTVLTIAQTGTHTGTLTVSTRDPDSQDGSDNGTGLAALEETYGFTIQNGAFSLDVTDECPDDPLKTSPGLCGCNIPDTAAGTECFIEMMVGRCSFGIFECSNGTGTCIGTGGSDEVCNGEDDDCDGFVDFNPNCPSCAISGEEEPCQAGALGECANGATICEEGTLVCRPSVPATEIPCNGLDDDCDGVVDGTCHESAATTLGGSCTYDLKKPENDKADVTIEFPFPDEPFHPDYGMEWAIRDGASQVHSRSFPGGPRGARAAAAGWTTKTSKNGNRKWTFKDAKDGSLGEPGQDSATVSCNAKKRVCTAKLSAKKIDLPAFAAGEITVSLTIDDDKISDVRTWELKSKGKKLVAAKDP